MGILWIRPPEPAVLPPNSKAPSEPVVSDQDKYKNAKAISSEMLFQQVIFGFYDLVRACVISYGSLVYE